MNINELHPQEVFSIFHEITQVPRPSKREGKIINWLKAFAVKHNLEHTVDEAGNIVMLCIFSLYSNNLNIIGVVM